MKKLFALLLAVLMLLTAAACSQVDTGKLEDLEIFKRLEKSINHDDTLDTIVDTFAEICKPLLSSEDNRYLYKAEAYEADGNHYIKLTMAAQFNVPLYKETLELDMVMVYAADEDMSHWEENKWVEEDFDAYISYIKSSNIFIKLIGKEAQSVDLDIGKA